MSSYAYYVETDPPRAVSLEQFHKLGFEMDVSQTQHAKQAARDLAQKLGYSLDQEGSEISYSLDLTDKKSRSQMNVQMQYFYFRMLTYYWLLWFSVEGPSSNH